MNCPRYNKIMLDCAMACRRMMQRSQVRLFPVIVIVAASIQPTTFGNADLASNFDFVLVDGPCP